MKFNEEKWISRVRKAKTGEELNELAKELYAFQQQAEGKKSLLDMFSIKRQAMDVDLRAPGLKGNT